MNKYNSFLLTLFLSIFFFNTSFSSVSYNCTIVQVINGSNLDISIFIESTGDDFVLGTSIFRININPAGLDITNVPSEITEGLWDNNNDGTNYADQYTGRSTADNWASINIEDVGTGSGVIVPHAATLVGKISIPIKLTTENSGIAWRKSPSVSPTQITDITHSDITSLGNFVDPGTYPLPVELSSFIASVNINNVNLNWKTATEVNNNGFEVQRAVVRGQGSEIGSQKSEAGSQWEKIGFMSGHGNSNSPKEYSFIDKNLTGGTNFVYRLKQIDNDGQYQYSKEVEVKVVPKDINLLQNYPNPFNPVTEIKFTLPEAARVTLRVYNIIGQEVASLVNGIEEAGFHSIRFEGSDLPSGTYIYRLQTGGFVQTKKMLLLK